MRVCRKHGRLRVCVVTSCAGCTIEWECVRFHLLPPSRTDAPPPPPNHPHPHPLVLLSEMIPSCFMLSGSTPRQAKEGTETRTPPTSKLRATSPRLRQPPPHLTHIHKGKATAFLQHASCFVALVAPVGLGGWAAWAALSTGLSRGAAGVPAVDSATSFAAALTSFAFRPDPHT